MRITSRHDGSCTACGTAIKQGEACEWDRFFGARCLSCEAEHAVPTKANRNAEDCHRCGTLVATGSGVVEWSSRRSAWSVRCRARRDCDHRADQRAAGK